MSLESNNSESIPAEKQQLFQDLHKGSFIKAYLTIGNKRELYDCEVSSKLDNWIVVVKQHTTALNNAYAVGQHYKVNIMDIE